MSKRKKSAVRPKKEEEKLPSYFVFDFHDTKFFFRGSRISDVVISTTADAVARHFCVKLSPDERLGVRRQIRQTGFVHREGKFSKSGEGVDFKSSDGELIGMTSVCCINFEMEE